MPSNGLKNSFGDNSVNTGFGFLTNQNPPPNSVLASGDPILFTIGSNTSPVDLSSIKITVCNETSFDGSGPLFDPVYLVGSAYSPNLGLNGYDFSLVRSGGFSSSDVVLVVRAKTTNGSPFVSIYSLRTNNFVSYPPLSQGLPLNSIPIGSLSGESHSGLLGGTAGQIFFSPGIHDANPDVSLDVDDIRLITYSSDKYVTPQTNNARPFLLGPRRSVTSWSISNATSSSGLIRITTSISNSLVDGQNVVVSGVIGVPANGSWKIKVVSATQFNLVGSTFSGVYVSGGSVGPPAYPPTLSVSYDPILNSPDYVLLKTKSASVRGTLTDSNTNVVTTILY